MSLLSALDATSRRPVARVFRPRSSLARPRSSLARRLSATMALVALASLGLFAFITIHLVDTEGTDVSSEQDLAMGRAVASALGVSYSRAGSWQAARLSDLFALATAGGLEVEVFDNSGRLVESAAPARAGVFGPALTFPVDDGATQVGTVRVEVGRRGFGRIGSSVRAALVGAVGWSAVGVALLTACVGILLSRRMTVPVRRLVEAARAVASGERSVRVATPSGTGDIVELSHAFNAMAGSLECHELLRRRLAADVAHELRTPVAVLQASLEAMVDGVIDVDTRSLSSLLDDTLRLSRIVKDLQVLASADIEALSLECHPVDLSVVAADAAASTEAEMARAGLMLRCELEPAVVNGDATRLYQVVANLLTNAMKFTPTGGRVKLAVAPQGGEAKLSVEDTGVGIPDDEIPHVFERFWRGRAATGRAGSGIGLAVVADLVHAHGGTVAAASVEGRGTRFVVTLLGG